MIIGIVGRKQSGKSAIGKVLIDKGYVVMPMAYTLKKMLLEMGVPHEALYGSEEQKEAPLEMLGGKSGRFAMQRLGTEWGRDLICYDLWVNLWKAQVKRMIVAGQNNIVCDDVRMYNECHVVEDVGGILIYVERPGTSTEDGHFSEKHIENLPYHYKLVNDGTLDDLARKIDAILAGAQGKKGPQHEEKRDEPGQAEKRESLSESGDY